MSISTSAENYELHLRSGKVGTQKERVLAFLRANQYHNFSRAELAKELGLPLSSICGRVNELMETGVISERPQRLCAITGNTINPVRVTTQTPLTH